MPNHHVKLFVDKDVNELPTGEISYVHHTPAGSSDDDGGRHTRAATGDRVRWRSRDDGGFKVRFDSESPFVSGAGNGSDIVATATNAGFETALETLKTISTTRKGFKYTVTFDSGESDDPEIIIDNSSGGGGKKKAKQKK